MSDERWLPDFPRHWLAVAGDDPSKPLPHDHKVCEQIEGAVTCLMTSGYRFWPTTGKTTLHEPPGGTGTVADGTQGMKRGPLT